MELNIEHYFSQCLEVTNEKPKKGELKNFIDKSLRKFRLIDTEERKQIFWISWLLRSCCKGLEMELSSVHLAIDFLHRVFEE